MYTHVHTMKTGNLNWKWRVSFFLPFLFFPQCSQHNGGKSLVKLNVWLWLLPACAMVWITGEQIIRFKSSEYAFGFDIFAQNGTFNWIKFHSIQLWQSFITVGPAVFNINNGTSSFRSMPNDFKQSRKSNFSPFVIRRVQPSDTNPRRCNSVNGLGRLLPVNWNEIRNF